MFLFIILEKNSKNFTGMFLSVQNVIPMVISYENLSQLYNISCSPEANKSKTTCRIWGKFLYQNKYNYNLYKFNYKFKIKKSLFCTFVETTKKE